MMPRRAVLLVLGLALLPTGVGLAANARSGTGRPVAPASPSARGEEGGPLRLVAQLTGADSINETDTAYGIDGTDLGHSFEYGGHLYMVFGDTFGQAKTDWRSNVAAVIADRDPSDGLTFARMITDAPGHAKELLPSGKGANGEVTVIPTSGVADGDRIFLHYMSVREWGTPGRWELNRSGFAYSDDGGQTWVSDPAATWPGGSNFGQVAIERVGSHAYLFGIPGGRFGGVQLARVEGERLLELGAYEYWDGTTWRRDDEAAASTILPAPVGELSVRWNAHYRQWLMMYLNEDKYAIVLRTADCLVGPWSEERTVVTGAEYPQLYAPYIPPRWNDGAEIYFTMSLFGPYNVYLMQTSLEGVPASTQDAECVTPR